MESIKTAITERVSAKYGPVCIEVQTKVQDPYYKLCILDEKYRDYVLYFWPNDSETRCSCYYAYREDLMACTEVSVELQNWKMPEVYQLTRQYDTRKKQLVPRICDYVDEAVANINLKRGISCRGSFTRIKTFEQAKLEAELYPEPRTAAVIYPPPKCKRNMEIHWEAEKKAVKKKARK